jgi:hypothetical protein
VTSLRTPAGSSSPSLRAILQRAGREFLRPTPEEARSAVARRWEDLPDSARLPEQVLGQASSGCGATWGVSERCNYACTACYLAADANRAPPLPFEEVRAQLDTLRASLGPGGNTQITSGEVTLLPVEELVRILRYCREIDLAPMVMTNGQVFLDDPDYLPRLVVEGGLDKIAIHIDGTQRGRPGWRPDLTECELVPAREASARLIREVRARTGCPLHAAHTVTVTSRNLAEIPAVVRWTVENSDAFRMLSLQPVAGVGRTTEGDAKAGREAVWQAVCEGLGANVDARGWPFGHSECNDVAVMLLVRAGANRHVIQSVRAGRRFDRWFLRRVVRGALGGFRTEDGPAPVVAANLLGRLVRDPLMLLQAPLYAGYRAWTERRSLVDLAGAVLRRRGISVRPFVVVVHHFMDAQELATPTGRERLRACAFRVPVDGKMVSMCEVNATGLRKELTARLRSGRREVMG